MCLESLRFVHQQSLLAVGSDKSRDQFGGRWGVNQMQYLKALMAGLVVFAPVFGMTQASVAQSAQLTVAQPTDSVVNVIIDQAVVINSDQAFREISVAQPTIADVAGINDRSLYVLGKTPGITTLTLLDDGGAVLAHVVVKVSIRPPTPAKTVRVRRGNEVIDEQVE